MAVKVPPEPTPKSGRGVLADDVDERGPGRGRVHRIEGDRIDRRRIQNFGPAGQRIVGEGPVWNRCAQAAVGTDGIDNNGARPRIGGAESRLIGISHEEQGAGGVDGHGVGRAQCLRRRVGVQEGQLGVVVDAENHNARVGGDSLSGIHYIEALEVGRGDQTHRVRAAGRERRAAHLGERAGARIREVGVDLSWAALGVGYEDVIDRAIRAIWSARGEDRTHTEGQDRGRGGPPEFTELHALPSSRSLNVWIRCCRGN
jgi:hypothetical protein